MTLSRWRRVVTGVAAGVIVLCAALIGASFRDDSGGVSVASELRPANVIPIEEDPADDADVAVETSDDPSTTDDADAATDEPDEAITEPVQVIETDDLAEPADAGASDTDTDTDTDTDAAADSDDAAAETEPADADDEAPTETPAATQTPTATETPTATQTPTAPLTATDDALGTGGGVDDAECALDRLVIYAGARRSGVAGSIRAALAQAGFGASCPAPVTVLASNCPLQFAGVLGAGSGYDPNTSFVASSASVDRETMTAVMSSVGFAGNQIDILDFGFANPDRPGEQWVAIFIPPSFEGWEGLAGRAGLSPTTSSLCSASGQLAG